MKAITVAEEIARDATCAQGEFHARVLSIIPYLTEHADEIERLRREYEEAAEAHGQILEVAAQLRTALEEIAHETCETATELRARRALAYLP